MNILPKKSWHVRNKDNVARVRRDEAEAEEQRRKKEARVLLAEQEARTEFLRKKARLSAPESHDKDSELVPLSLETPTGHLNLFQELQESGNKEYEEEKKKEKERQEKALGILTYLGQSAAEAQTNRPWYQEAPERDKAVVKDEKLKGKLDPLLEMERHLRKKKSSHKKEGKKEKEERRGKEKGNLTVRPTSSSTSSPLEQLRQERLRREKAERARAESLLGQRAGTLQPQEAEEELDDRKRGYNSQFHPQLARKRVWEPQ
ncbi:leukocyte receptor cluster member 1 [Anolis carolinensis]|uniref:Leukocyte receptor cluster member 1 n=1 Tax=Anolis carolinensis TaxID=28377 RepID=H9GQC5_ANOCA|nr:PREDICTED: leukocyte receptor cluster member 1 [Anolis carolinensis]|eukprot:XP_008115446.1 PREDICTED: leukocyte receptor cluster member 1 [Anolis carolinensis]